MSKQWTCKDCVKQNTDACYFTEVLDGHKYCHDIVVDVDCAYEQGRLDAIDEFKALIYENLYDEDNQWFNGDSMLQIWKSKLEELAEQLMGDISNARI